MNRSNELVFFLRFIPYICREYRRQTEKCAAGQINFTGYKISLHCVDPYTNQFHYMYTAFHIRMTFMTRKRWRKEIQQPKFPKTCSTKNNAVKCLFFFACYQYKMPHEKYIYWKIAMLFVSVLWIWNITFMDEHTHIYKFEKYFICNFQSLSIEFHLGQGKNNAISIIIKTIFWSNS